MRAIHANQLEIDNALEQYAEKEQLLINQAMPKDKDMEKLMLAMMACMKQNLSLQIKLLKLFTSIKM